MNEVFKNLSIRNKIFNYQDIPFQHRQKLMISLGFILFKVHKLSFGIVCHYCLDSLLKNMTECCHCKWRLYNGHLERIIRNKFSNFDAECIRSYVKFSTQI